MRWRIGIGYGHYQEEAGVAGVGREPFFTIQHPLIALQDGAGREGRGVGTALRLGHREAGDDVVGQQGLQVPGLLVFGPIDGKDLGIAGVGGLAAKDGRREDGAPQDFVHQGQLDLTVAGTAQLRSEVAGPKAAILDLRLQRPDEPAVQRVVDIERTLENEVQRLYFLADECVDPGELFGEIGVGLEIPGHRRFRSF